MAIEYIIGIDEVGRGPLAGPVTICALAIPTVYKNILKKDFRGVRDSKQLSAEGREEWLRKIKKFRNEEKIFYATTSVSNSVIDTRGLSFAIKLAIKKSLAKLKFNPAKCLVLLDGGIYAPEIYRNQKTIIKGDEKEPIIALASITAKVFRDKKMSRLAKIYPNYDFEIHKGYGTAEHYKKIKKYGISPIHRRSFLKKLGL